MITHVVLFKLKERTPEKINQTRDILLGMEGKIPQLRYLEVGADEVKSDRSYDIALITRFETWQDLDTYRTHPVHLKVLEHMKAVTDVAAAVDYAG